jgi:hypothetical protein
MKTVRAKSGRAALAQCPGYLLARRVSDTEFLVFRRAEDARGHPTTRRIEQ